eukprot:4451479-Amphidinium_carterae.1
MSATIAQNQENTRKTAKQQDLTSTRLLLFRTSLQRCHSKKNTVSPNAATVSSMTYLLMLNPRFEIEDCRELNEHLTNQRTQLQGAAAVPDAIKRAAFTMQGCLDREDCL